MASKIVAAGKEALIQDVTPANHNTGAEVARYELESLPEKRTVYLKKGALYFLSSKKEALEKLQEKERMTSMKEKVLGLDTLE